MATHTLDIATWRATFPEFANATTYPDAQVQLQWNLGAGYLGAEDGPLIEGPALQSALDLMAAHLLQLFTKATRGQVAGVVVGSTIDKTQVQLAPPPFKNGWGYWLSLTPYGVTLNGLLRARGAGGYYIGGSPERFGFRRVGGGFGPGYL